MSYCQHLAEQRLEDIEKKHFTKGYRGHKVVESHNHQLPEGTRHIDEKECLGRKLQCFSRCMLQTSSMVFRIRYPPPPGYISLNRLYNSR